ncbi:MAG TPA: hypothetical protein VE907_06405, partial [Gammaproteobacteria bacterium]|nr:hypothetical protein [Gammaproteobacteria bacterium]
IKLLQFGTKAIELGAEGVALLEQATAKVQTMVDENRGLTEEEDAALDASIQAKLDAIAATKIDA